jgi:hypothetical protein
MRRQADARTPDIQWHQRQYDSGGNVKLDASGNEVWKPIDLNSMSHSELEPNIQDGDLAERDVRGLSAVDVKQGLRMGRMADAAQKLDDTTQKIYDLSRERTGAIQQQTGQPDLRQERRTASMQGNIDDLEKLAKSYGPEYNDMFGRKDGITDLIAAAQKIGYGDNGAKYTGTLGDYAKKTFQNRTSLTGKDSLGVGMLLLAKTIGLPHTGLALAAETAAESAHNRFMHKVATNPDYADKVLTKDRSPKGGIRLTASTLANLGAQATTRADVSKKVQQQGGTAGRDID